jgi:hypothetical protein
MIAAKNNVYQFTIKDFDDICLEAGLNPDDVMVSPVFNGKNFDYYLVDKYDWKVLIVLSDISNAGTVINDTPNYASGERIHMDKCEAWYTLLWRKINARIKTDSKNKKG